ncbi:PIN domain-containing protein [Maricaulis sp.]|uniref:PIN domain-containing protein n=1 Tax=Maricaulis sp. TaxID=1486257 RepID=UPI003A94E4AD
MSDRADRFTVVLDANVLASALGRNMLLSLAEAGLFRPRWSIESLDETERAISKIAGDPAVGKRHRNRIEAAFPEARVDGHQILIDAIKLKDPDDRHVVAAAIRTRAAIIVTENLKDFDADTLEALEIQCLGLDAFVADLIDMAGPEAVEALRQMRERFKAPEMTAEALIRRVEAIGLVDTATLLEKYAAFL